VVWRNDAQRTPAKQRCPNRRRAATNSSLPTVGGCARTAGHTKAARCPRHCRYLTVSKACIVMLHLQSKDRTTYVRNLLTSAWKAAGGSIANVSVISASRDTASTGTGKQWTRVAPWNQRKYSRCVASSNDPPRSCMSVAACAQLLTQGTILSSHDCSNATP
jgi:hypothetical protein